MSEEPNINEELVTISPKPGRMLNKERRAQVCAILGTGGTLEIAANYLGCSVAAIRRTAEKYADFEKALRRSASQYEISHLQNIQSAAKNERNWRAAAWTLERQFPQRYARRSPETVTADQVAQLLAALGETIASEVTDRALRRRVIGRLRQKFRSIARSKRRKATHG